MRSRDQERNAPKRTSLVTNVFASLSQTQYLNQHHMIDLKSRVLLKCEYYTQAVKPNKNKIVTLNNVSYRIFGVSLRYEKYMHD